MVIYGPEWLMGLSRRTFLKTGIVGGAVLATGGLLTRGTFWGNGAQLGSFDGVPFRFLTRKDQQLMRAVVPVVLTGAIQGDPAQLRARAESVIAGVDRAIAGLQPAVQKELRQLFNLLNLAPFRMACAGVWSPWEDATPTAVDGFLNRWQNSSVSLFRSAYDAIQQLTCACWYGNPHSWTAIGYPGPPQLA